MCAKVSDSVKYKSVCTASVKQLPPCGVCLLCGVPLRCVGFKRDDCNLANEPVHRSIHVSRWLILCSVRGGQLKNGNICARCCCHRPQARRRDQFCRLSFIHPNRNGLYNPPQTATPQTTPTPTPTHTHTRDDMSYLSPRRAVSSDHVHARGSARGRVQSEDAPSGHELGYTPAAARNGSIHAVVQRSPFASSSAFSAE